MFSLTFVLFGAAILAGVPMQCQCSTDDAQDPKFLGQGIVQSLGQALGQTLSIGARLPNDTLLIYQLITTLPKGIIGDLNELKEFSIPGAVITFAEIVSLNKGQAVLKAGNVLTDTMTFAFSKSMAIKNYFKVAIYGFLFPTTVSTSSTSTTPSTTPITTPTTPSTTPTTTPTTPTTTRPTTPTSTAPTTRCTCP